MQPLVPLGLANLDGVDNYGLENLIAPEEFDNEEDVNQTNGSDIDDNDF